MQLGENVPRDPVYSSSQTRPWNKIRAKSTDVSPPGTVFLFSSREEYGGRTLEAGRRGGSCSEEIRSFIETLSYEGRPGLNGGIGVNRKWRGVTEFRRRRNERRFRETKHWSACRDSVDSQMFPPRRRTYEYQLDGGELTVVRGPNERWRDRWIRIIGSARFERGRACASRS